VREPGYVIPRSIIISVFAVALIYIAINLSIIGVVSWREFVPASANPKSDFIVSVFMERLYGSRVATLFTALVLWTAFGSVFALLLGYSGSRRGGVDGTFFKSSGASTDQALPHVSLVVIGLVAIAASTLSLGMVIDALITTRILVQFIGQVVALTLLRRHSPEVPRPFRVWLYPVPNLVALFGWIFLFATSGTEVSPGPGPGLGFRALGGDAPGRSHDAGSVASTRLARPPHGRRSHAAWRRSCSRHSHSCVCLPPP
jgi:amino acid transporter